MAECWTRRNFLETAGTAAVGLLGARCLLAAGAGVPRRKPNIILILADDLGWMDTSLTGKGFYRTPNIERLARRGMFFSNAYAASPICSPTRASIMTGQSPARVGITSPACHVPQEILTADVQPQAPPQDPQRSCISATRLKLEYYTLAEALKDGGYATGHFGKWHLGPDPYDPRRQGFDVDIPHWPGPGPAGSYLAPWRFPRFKPRTPHEHIEDRMGDEAVAFIEKHPNQPFFVNYWQFSVHAPFDAKPELIAEYEKRVDPDNPRHCPTYAAMVQSLDENVGKILDAVDRLGIADNTVIFFFSDNGGNMYDNVRGAPATSNSPLRGGKGTIYEGGTRTPAVVVWPGVVKSGARSEAFIESEDLYPTILEVAGIPMQRNQPCDGLSMLPALRGRKPLRNAVFCYFPHAPKIPAWLPPSASVRKGDWKLIRVFFGGDNGAHRYELYNLRDDIGERRNLAAKHPAKVRELDALITDFLERTHAVLPQPNPNYDPRAVDRIGGWETTDNRRVRLSVDRRWNRLLCRVFEPNPLLVTSGDLDLPPGRYRFEVAMTARAGGAAAVAWLGGDGRREKGRAVMPVTHDGLPHEYAVDWEAKQAVTGLRFIPCTEQGTLQIQRIRLRGGDGKVVREWAFDKMPPRPRPKPQPVVGGWRGGPNGHAACTLRNGVLHIESSGGDPMIMTARPLKAPPGEYVLKLRMKARARGGGQAFARPASRGYLRGSGTAFAVHHDGGWHDYEVRVRVDRPLHELRLDPCSGPGAVDIDRVRLERADGRLVREWTFDKP